MKRLKIYSLFLISMSIQADIEVDPEMASSKLDCENGIVQDQKIENGLFRRICFNSEKKAQGIVKLITSDGNEERVLGINRVVNGQIDSSTTTHILWKNDNSSPLLWFKNNYQSGKLKSITVQPFQEMSQEELQSLVYNGVANRINKSNKSLIPCTREYASMITCDEGKYKYIGSNSAQKIINSSRNNTPFKEIHGFGSNFDRYGDGKKWTPRPYQKDSSATPK